MIGDLAHLRAIHHGDAEDTEKVMEEKLRALRASVVKEQF